MCGIVGVVRRPSGRVPPTGDELLPLVDRALGALDGLDRSIPGGELLTRVAEACAALTETDRLLRGTPGVRALVGDHALVGTLTESADVASRRIAGLEASLDERSDLTPGEIERLNAALVSLKDAAWAVRQDRLRTGRAVADLAGAQPSDGAIEGLTSVQQALSAIDRLEVRGRDSAGLHLLASGHGLDLSSPAIASMIRERSADPLFRSGSVRQVDGALSFVYKAAAEIGELGDNTSVLRAAIVDDPLLHQALASGARLAVLGHTRWASVGIISQANAHPLNSEELSESQPYSWAVLNGDVDNFADLKASVGLELAPEITTDAKVIPTLVSRRLAAGEAVDEAFRHVVASLEGSVAIAGGTAAAPDRLHLALRGSGQALYVGLAEDAYIVASEPYGLVEETSAYLRLDGETPADPANPTASRGQIVALDAASAGDVASIHREGYDGTPLPVSDADLSTAEITTRDIDRGDHPHYLLKEITESPESVRKTLRGRLVERDGDLSVTVGPDTIPDDLRARLADGSIRRLLVIGQGTAAVAGQSLAAIATELLAGADVSVQALPATELSGFALRPAMDDTLVVAISQSGTTTDTNRTVDLARARGAPVVAIVNRRNSDLTDKADGVLYTSDGRDVEMSVASTKAFYGQVAAGALLACAVADAVGAEVDGRDRARLLGALRDLPTAMATTLERRPEIAEAARTLAPPRRYWAVVGNGSNRVAASEVRIKLSELCYKSIACDTTEDKKHIDLSSEPLILVCAAGLTGSTADDVAKEVAIYRAHKAAPVVVATEGEGRFGAALYAIGVPESDPRLAFVLSAMVGHLFGYEAALAIDAQARPLREARAAVEEAVSSSDRSDDVLARLGSALVPHAARFNDGLRGGEYDGHMEASTSVRLASLFRYAAGAVALDAYQSEHGKVGTPSVVVEDLTSALTQAIGELTRPIDAIKHQAKTVTVGISRSDETLLEIPLVREVLAAGAPRDHLTYSTLRTLADLDPAVAEVTGFTRYRIEGWGGAGPATSVVVDRGGISREFPSRTERNPELRGTKNRVASERQILAARGRADGRTIVLVPEAKDDQPTGITLLHVRFADRLPVGAARGALRGYRNRYAQLRDAVTETEPTFRDDLLADIPVVDLLTEPVGDLAERWRSPAGP